MNMCLPPLYQVGYATALELWSALTCQIFHNVAALF